MSNIFLAKIKILDRNFLPEIKLRSFYFPVSNIRTKIEEIDDVVCEFEINSKTLPAVCRKNNGQLITYFNASQSLKIILNETLFKPKEPLYAKLPFHYHLIPAEIRKLLPLILSSKKKFLGNYSSSIIFPNWPIDYSVYLLTKLLQLTQDKQEGFIQQINLPKGKKYALCLTHDVDTYQGFRKITDFVKLEQRLELLSTFYLPAFHYDIDFDQLKAIEKDGFEIGIHGYNHDGRLPFLTSCEIEKRVKRARDKFKDHVKVYGYRSPSFLRTPRLYKILEKYFEYDSSSPDTFNFNLQTNFNGCGSVFPYRRGKILEIPLTVPDEADLLMRHFTPNQILKIWKEKIEFIKNANGVAVILTHTDPHFCGDERMLNFYKEFLKEIKKDKTCLMTTCKDLIQKTQL